jgi:hypothetical protein
MSVPSVQRLAFTSGRVMIAPAAVWCNAGWAAASAANLRELVWVGAFDDHRIDRRRGIPRYRGRRWPIIDDEGDPASSADDVLQVDALTISEHHLMRPTGCPEREDAR